MWRSTRLLLVRIGFVIAAILVLSLCALVASWRGLIVLLSMGCFIGLLLAGWYFILRRTNGGEFLDLVLFSLWFGFMMFGLVFVMLYVDPRGTTFSIWRNVGVAALVGGGFFAVMLLLTPIHQRIGAVLFRGRLMRKPRQKADGLSASSGPDNTGG